MAEYRRGQGPDALPQGAAAALNAAQPPTGQGQDPFAAPGAEVPVMFAPAQDDDEALGGLNENMQIMLEAPNPDYRASVAPKDRADRVPRYVVRHLPTLMAAVRDPSAPPTLRALYRAVLRQLEIERAKGRR